jgi:hypothetical protein
MAATLTRCRSCGQLVRPVDYEQLVRNDYADELDAVGEVFHTCPAETAPARFAPRPRRPVKVTAEELALVRQLRAEDAHRWTYIALGELVGVSDRYAWHMVHDANHPAA